MFTSLYDPQTGSLSYTNAGHPPSVIYSEGEARELPGKGFPVGFLEDFTYSTENTTLKVGDVVVLITDGLTEAQNRSAEMYGTRRLLDLVTRLAPDASVQAISREILDDLHHFRDGRILKDDVTIAVLKRTA